MDAERPQNVGVLAMEVYFPRYFVAQSDLERYDGVPAGKYTLGLGQDAMAFTGDREDVNSIALTCVAALLEKYSVDPREIGRLEVGTETLVDKSKSTKTVLMQLFEASGNTDVDGASTINACYGATAAVLNAVAWVESSAWDGRYALVVAADIAVYAKGSARPTGGCAGVAMLIGPDAPLVLDTRSKVTSAVHTWDFYKPDPSSEFATVDGALSQTCYLKSLDDCYLRFCAKSEQHACAAGEQRAATVDLAAFDFAVFHSPYNKLVQKSFARLTFLDARRDGAGPKYDALAQWMATPLDETMADRELDLAARKVAGDGYSRKVGPTSVASKQLGNCYTGSVYVNLASLVDAKADELDGARVLLFSYGSGSIASMYTVRGREPTASGRFSLARMAAVLRLAERLDARQQVSAEEFAVYMALRERVYGRHSLPIVQPVSSLAPGTYYLEHIDAKFRRTYARTPSAAGGDSGDSDDRGAVLARAGAFEAAAASEAKSAAWSRAGAVFVSGVGAGLPGQREPCGGQVSLDLLLAGTNCIEPLDAATKDAILARNIVLAANAAPSGSDEAPERRVVVTHADSVQLAAVVQPFDLAKQYGVSAALAGSMDATTQLAVAAGLDALKNAGLVAGNGTTGQWRLPESLQTSVGVIYASSFPATSAALAEANRFHAAQCDNSDKGDSGDHYAFDRKFLFRLLVLANAQLAQLTGARGPNAQVNAACAGTTQAIGMAQDWLALGKCERVVVVASDLASSAPLVPWIAAGFRALGAASTAASVEGAALPFDRRRNGMVLGGGAVGLVLEAASAFAARCPRPVVEPAGPKRVRLLCSRFSNSAFHGASLNPSHVAEELVAFLLQVERDFGVSRAELAAHGVYYSHETCTNASPTASCAFAEVTALRRAFGEPLLAQLTIANTKGFTGHPMGVSFEDVAAVEGLRQGRVPPVANFQEHDAHLGDQPLRLARGGEFVHKYALRFAAGFGSQLAFTLYALEP
ncbi:hypothetical protein PybrP1_010723 [[Pythium] brassicae (nom. inval.)]|nr:hypothetical protein PybrP1_010723 [[Pythium] brassicae (nom. inval.)]